MEGKTTHVLVLDDVTREKLDTIAAKAHAEIKKCENEQEMAVVLRILIESFEDHYKAKVPFKGRYEEPVYNYQERI